MQESGVSEDPTPADEKPSSMAASCRCIGVIEHFVG